MRHMSFSMTTLAVRRHDKTVTRRLGWQYLKPGDEVLAVERTMGLRKGGRHRRLAVIRVVDVTREPLEAIVNYGPGELEREGFPGMTAEEFITLFCAANRVERDFPVTRIEFEYPEAWVVDWQTERTGGGPE